MYFLNNALFSDSVPETTVIRILLLEDDPTDIELIQTALERSGIHCQLTCVHNQADFAAVITTRFDLILADYLLPSFDGLAALHLARAHDPEVPFIIVSGVLGEERAIETLQQGATDYILKQRLERLVPAVQRAIREHTERQQRQQAEDSLRKTDEILRTVIEASPVAIITLSADRRVMTWNTAAEQMYGWRASEVVDRPLLLIPTDYQDQFEDYFQQALQQPIKNLEVLHCQKSGAPLHVSMSLAPLPDRYGESPAVVMTAADVTSRKQIEEQRLRLLEREQAARAEAEAANRVKDEFLAVLSHELRTPLNAIMGWSKLLRRGRLNATMVQQAIEVIERNATAQTRLIEDLLDTSWIIRGKVSLTLQPVDLAQLIRDMVKTLQPAAEAKSITVRLMLSNHLVPISADPGRLRQVVWNLLSNAIKFTPTRGQVTVALEQVNGDAQIQVTDTGIGIPDSFLPRVFHYFCQADASTTRSQGGLGLGLAISRHLVELHGGSIHAESAGVGQGATFTVRLPMRLLTQRTAPHRVAALQNLRIMVVEDEPDARELLLVVLRQQGAEVLSTSSVQAALETIVTFQPDILISDIGMPGEDGYSLLRQVRTLPQYQSVENLPALALTAYAHPEDRERALAAGFQGHLAKPVDPTELVEVIQCMVGQRSVQP